MSKMLARKEVIEEYERKVWERLIEVKLIVGKSVSEVFRVFKDARTAVAVQDFYPCFYFTMSCIGWLVTAKVLTVVCVCKKNFTFHPNFGWIRCWLKSMATCTSNNIRTWDLFLILQTCVLAESLNKKCYYFLKWLKFCKVQARHSFWCPLIISCNTLLERQNTARVT